ncbi:Zn-dependent protease [Saccharomonospora marina XMU15]|uniref:Zinc metalloprotease n=1 Tax=Saccharomonospora marina XMU15 TaxID=882083 RepID=H5X2H2_9PSEU|nr:site-2 protease family protein [Saccharomonospora marina]EHR49837.1 Zn-dependent protease [Saccharomonospora marina XMU15]
MNPTIKLGTVAGVRVGLHWSVLGILLVLVFALGFARWPLLVPGYSTWVYLLAAVVAALLFLASLLAHELSHAVVARRNGIAVEDITLWLLGGVAKLRSEARTPGAELRIAGAGPLASLLTAALFGLITWLLVAADATTLLVATAGYLALINVVLAAFNLVPAAPLDGGRVLRAALWAWRGDRTRAAVWSARAGRIFGFALILLGAWRLLFAGVGDGLWWILIGLFITSMASAEERQAQVGAMLADVAVGDVMTRDPDTTDGDMSVRRFLDEVALSRKHSAFPLLDARGGVEGLVTLNRLRSVPSQQRDTTPLRQAACPPEQIPTATPQEPLTDLLRRMEGCTDGRALVFEDGRLVGIVSPTDISRVVTLRGMDAGWRQGGSDLTAPRPPGRRI